MREWAVRVKVKPAGISTALVLGALAVGCLDTTDSTPLPVASLSVSPSVTTLHIEQAVQLQVTARNARGRAMPLLPALTWASSDTSVVRVSPSGVAVAESMGTATLTVRTRSIEATATVTTIARDPRPNIIVLITDDARTGDFDYTPQIRALLSDSGMTFDNFFVTTGTCCPSRASILRGQYAHNHQTLTNLPPAGSFMEFRALGNEASTLATWLHAAGYETGLFGKYLNLYPGFPNPDLTYVPPGWDSWHAVFSPSEGNPAYYYYSLNEDGVSTDYGEAPSDYLTDVLTDRVSKFVTQAQFRGTPFFMYIAPYAPHEPSTPSPTHLGAFAGVPAPRTPAFNEADVSDKWLGVRRLPLLTDSAIADLDARYDDRLASLLSVDDMVKALLAGLRQTGSLDNTYVFLLSDNGLETGEHRMVMLKETPYEETIRVPLVVRGPGIPFGVHNAAMTLNIDLAPTIMDLASSPAPAFVDGRSLAPLLSGTPPGSWRHAFAEEVWAEDSSPAPRLIFQELRSDSYAYVEYYDGERELYDIRNDPYELSSIYSTTPKSLISQLSGWLAELRTCAASSCRVLDVAP